MKRLIINADDLGADTARNEGIFEAIRAGVVTSASLLPNGPALEHALGRIREGGFERVSFGVHLNLSEGRPLTPGRSLLSGPDGPFAGKAAIRRLLMNPEDPALRDAVARETALQVDRLLDALPGITHLDGHQHTHIFPAALRPVTETALSRGIRRMRIPHEEGFMEDGASPPVNTLAGKARESLSGTGLVSSDHFRGLSLMRRLNLHNLLDLVPAIPEGVTELMVHPGRAPGETGFSPFSSKDRERELEALIDPRFRLALRDAGVGLISWREVAG